MASLGSVRAAGTEPRSKIVPVNANHYVGLRAQDADLTFVLTRLTDENLPIWWKLHGKSYYNEYRPNLEKIWDDSWSDEQMHFMLQGIETGAMAFRNTLYKFEDSKESRTRPEVWISYILSGKGIDPATPVSEKLFPHMEMVLTVLTHPEVPFVLHMGIGRTMYNMKKIYDRVLPQHKALSIPLHNFTARAILQTHNGRNKLWMITRPSRAMAEIMKKELPQGSYRKGNDNMPVNYEKESLIVKTEEGDIAEKFPRGDERLGFYSHPEMFQPLDPYAIPYSSLAKSF